MYRCHSRRPVDLARNTRGFTLFEVLIAISIMSFVFLLVGICMKIGFDAYANDSERIRMQQFAQLTVQRIASGLNKAESVAIDADGSGLVFSFGNNGYYYFFDESMQQIKCRFISENNITKASALHSSDIQVIGCTFSNHGDYIQIGITLQTKKNARNGRPEYRISTDVPVPNRQQ